MAAITETAIRVVLEREKETKRTVRYAEPGEDQLVGTLYVPKTTLDRLGGAPPALELVIRPEESAL
jgi:hypothetical protein